MPDGFDNTLQPGEQFALSPVAEPGWRQEVASRLDRYRIRRKRTGQERSMRLNFEPVAPAEPRADEGTAPEAREHRGRTRQHHVPAALRNLPPEPGLPAEEHLEEQQPAGEISSVAQEAGSERQDNVLQFPRSALYPVICEELAEPVQQAPRILDVPEELELTPAPMVDIGLAPLHEPAQEARGFGLPLPVASMERRVLASGIDLLIVLGGGALFLGLLDRWGVRFPEARLSVAIEVASATLFWVIYQVLFLVHGGGTPGMQVTGIELAEFTGERVGRSSRQWRALGMVLSYLPLGLGLAWAFFDEDGLCWHDRISHTYLRMDEVQEQTAV